MTESWYLVAGTESYQVHQLTNRYGTDLIGIGMPPVEHVKQRAPRQDGATRVATILGERTIDVAYVYKGTTRQAYWEELFAIAELFKRFDDLVLRIVLGTGESFDIDVVYLADTLTNVGTKSYFMGIRLEASNPLFYKTAVSTLVVGVPQIAGAFKFPLTFPVVFGSTSINTDIALTYEGSWKAYPQIDLKGPIENPLITNNTTSETLSMTVAIPDGQTVRIDLNPRGKSVWNITTDTNWMQYLDDDSDLATWHLEAAPDAPGGINDLHFEGLNGGDATAITLRWNDQFIALGRRAT